MRPETPTKAELYQQRDKLRGQLDYAVGKMTELQAENAKLRELARALADCRNATCGDCVRWDYPEGGCSLDGVLRELGVEVGG